MHPINQARKNTQSTTNPNPCTLNTMPVVAGGGGYRPIVRAIHYVGIEPFHHRPVLCMHYCQPKLPPIYLDLSCLAYIGNRTRPTLRTYDGTDKRVALFRPQILSWYPPKGCLLYAVCEQFNTVYFITPLCILPSFLATNLLRNKLTVCFYWVEAPACTIRSHLLPHTRTQRRQTSFQIDKKSGSSY